MAKKSRDDVLRKMLKTPPQPKKANGKAGAPQKKSKSKKKTAK